MTWSCFGTLGLNKKPRTWFVLPSFCKLRTWPLANPSKSCPFNARLIFCTIQKKLLETWKKPHPPARTSVKDIAQWSVCGIFVGMEVCLSNTKERVNSVQEIPCVPMSSEVTFDHITSFQNCKNLSWKFAVWHVQWNVRFPKHIFVEKTVGLICCQNVIDWISLSAHEKLRPLHCLLTSISQCCLTLM